MRGKSASIGATKVSPNGYHYTKTERKWELTHRLIAERKLGRPLSDNEYARFKDNDRTNLNPDNIIVKEYRQRSVNHKINNLEARIEELQAKLESLRSSMS